MSQPYNPPPAGPPAKSGGGMSVLMIVLIVLIVLGLICAGACGVCVYSAGQFGKQVGGAVMAAMLHIQAQSAVQSSDEVKAKFGEPLTIGEPTNQNFNFSATPPSISFDFPVSGPNGSGTAHVEGSQAGEQWKINALEVRADDGTVIKVDPNVAPSTDLNFPEFDDEGKVKMDDEPSSLPGSTDGSGPVTPDESN